MEASAVVAKSGLIGWAALGVGLGIYEAYAIKTKRIETLSTALHKLEGTPAGLAAVVWSGLTFHLFVEPRVKKCIKGRK